MSLSKESEVSADGIAGIAGMILVVDDDPGTAELQRRKLQRSGYRVTAESDPKKARRLVAERNVALIVLDYRLADNRTGLEFYQELKTGGDVPPTILVTGFSNEALVVQALRAGVDDFVAKTPDYLEYLPYAVRQVLNNAETERRLVDSESRKTAMLEAALDGVVVIDDAGKILEFNPAAEQMFGYRRSEVMNQSMADLLVPCDSRSAHENGLKRYLETGASKILGRRVEMTALRRDGTEFPVELSVVALRVGDRRMFTAYARDITERKRLETGLQLQQRALEEVSEGILFTNPNQPDNPIVYVNPAFERITGYKAADVIGKNFRLLQGPGTDEKALDEVRRAFAECRGCQVEMLNYRADGKPFWNALSLNPLHDDAGRVTHFIAVQIDVSQRRLLEEQVRQSQKMEAVGRLAGGIAHDFNNLLTVILGNAEFAKEDAPSNLPDLREKIDEITEAARRAVMLTGQLLAFSRKQVLEPENVSVNALIGNLDKMLRRLIGEDVDLATKLDAEADRIKADPNQFEQVIINLAVNARDAMPDGGTLLIETGDVSLDADYAAIHTEVRPGRYVRISVSDTGGGIAASVLPHIFEPFYTTKPPGMGTGLGLATVFGIVKQSGGHIAVYSEPGLGTTFHVYFPTANQTAPLRTPSASPDAAPTGDETILLVEDEEPVRRLATRILSGLGYTVVAAANGAEALEVAAEHDQPIHALVTDVVMPGMTGVQVAEKLRITRPDVRVVYVSGYTNDAVIRRGLLQPGTAFVQKPFTKETLGLKLRQVLDA